MTLVVPFDGSKLAEAALVRATAFGSVFDEDVLAVSVIPKGNPKYAREHGWLEQNEEFEMETIVATLHEQVTDLSPSADFRHNVVGRYATAGSIAKQVRKIAQKEDASMVFIGSENAGRLATTVSSVGSTVATAQAYDVVIVRDCTPSKIAKIRNASSQEAKSDFYIPE
ncbi:universal stress protein [Halovenus salina]|uniref:Universal stress protein n=1 Tax=Halovenus salina TaxID=1510225 RepID=A0ABD5VYK7_9EURY|nr:universal stress protein [Halovenus salina]